MKKIMISTGVLALGLGLGTATAGASASASVHRVTVPETVLGHDTRATYKVRPSRVARLTPQNIVISTRWSAWSGMGARGRGVLTTIGQSGGGVPCRIVLSRVRSGHFTRMRVTTQASPNSPIHFRWSAGRIKVWRRT
jgi:hypothetical protein